MGVNYNPVLALGTEFDTASECVDFVRHMLTEGEKVELDDEGDSYITEIAYDRNDGFPTVQGLDLYSGEGYYVGYRINCRSVQAFESSLKDAQQKWQKNFPDEEATIIHTARIS